jgi:hypothetical protein
MSPQSPPSRRWWLCLQPRKQRWSATLHQAGKVFKINVIQVANVDGTNAADVTIDVHSAAAGGGTAFSLVSTASVPSDASLVALSKNTAIYLEEDRSITATASTANDLEVIISYEEIS